MLLQSLNEFYQQACQKGIIEHPAFTKKNIRWLIPIDLEGNVEGVGLIQNAKLDKGGREFRVPRSSRPKNAGDIAEFLWGGIEEILGLKEDPITPDKNEREKNNRVKKYNDFWRQVSENAQKSFDPFLDAILKFHSNRTTDYIFLRWGLSLNDKEEKSESKTNKKSKKASKDEEQKPCWWVKLSNGTEEKLKEGDYFSFQVDGNILLDNPIVQSLWLESFALERAGSEEKNEKGICLVTGQINVPISASHLPKISGVPNANSTGATLVAFDKSAFRSYGFDKSYNSPISIAAVEAYCNTLNFLLSTKNYRVKTDTVAFCFWTKEKPEYLSLFAELIEEAQADQVKSFLTQPFSGQEKELRQKEQFYSVTLTGNSARVIIRHWMQISLEQAVINLKQWFSDLDIVVYGNKQDNALSLTNLSRTTVRDKSGKDSDRSKPTVETVSHLYRAAIEGATPSLTLATSILNRLSKDLTKEKLFKLTNLYSRFALLKLIINRNKKGEEPVIEPEVFETKDTAYNCGRLLALFDDLQAAAHEYKLEGPGVVERYYGSACATPNSAFGILWRLHQHHLNKLSRQGDKGRAAATAIKRKIAEIVCHFRPTKPNLPPQFPRAFNLKEQGRFALGFYQQKAVELRQKQMHLNKNTLQTEKLETNGGSNND